MNFVLSFTLPCAQMRALVDMEGSGLVAMLAGDKHEDLARMYALFKRVDGGLPLMRQARFAGARSFGGRGGRRAKANCVGARWGEDKVLCLRSKVSACTHLHTHARANTHTHTHTHTHTSHPSGPGRPREGVGAAAGDRPGAAEGPHSVRGLGVGRDGGARAWGAPTRGPESPLLTLFPQPGPGTPHTPSTTQQAHPPLCSW